MLTIAKIKPSSFSFTELSYETIDHDLSKLLKDYIDIVSIRGDTSENTMQDILEQLDLPANTMCHSYKCFEDSNKITYLLYCTDSKNPTNYIGRFLSEKHEEVFGNCCILQTIDDIDNNVVNCSITLDDVTKIIRRRFIHKAILLQPDGKMYEKVYTNNPIDIDPSFNENNCRCIHIEVLNKVLCMFIQCQPTIDSINEYATILGKKNRINGSVIISLLSQTPSVEIMDLTESLMMKILCAMSNHNISRTETNDDTSQNFYVNLERRVLKMDNKINSQIPDDVLSSHPLNSTFN
jgi:hypothetical protein